MDRTKQDKEFEKSLLCYLTRHLFELEEQSLEDILSAKVRNMDCTQQPETQQEKKLPSKEPATIVAMQTRYAVFEHYWAAPCVPLVTQPYEN